MSHEEKLHPLTILLKLFNELSAEPMTEADFELETLVRWSHLDHQAGGWRIPSGGELDGFYELNLREDVLMVRTFKNRPHAEPACICKMKIILKGDEFFIRDDGIEFPRDTDEADAKAFTAFFLLGVSRYGDLEKLERAMYHALKRFIDSNDLVSSCFRYCEVAR